MFLYNSPTDVDCAIVVEVGGKEEGTGTITMEVAAVVVGEEEAMVMTTMVVVVVEEEEEEVDVMTTVAAEEEVVAAMTTMAGEEAEAVDMVNKVDAMTTVAVEVEEVEEVAMGVEAAVGEGMVVVATTSTQTKPCSMQSDIMAAAVETQTCSSKLWVSCSREAVNLAMSTKIVCSKPTSSSTTKAAVASSTPLTASVQVQPW